VAGGWEWAVREVLHALEVLEVLEGLEAEK